MAPQLNNNPVSQALVAAIDAHVRPGEKLCVGLSGGIDSTVLLHALTQLPALGERVTAVHVNHGLHPESGEWAVSCQATCTGLGVPLRVLEVSIDPAAPGGPEARARTMRYQAIRNSISQDEVLLTAHHKQDQAETFLLQLMRGAGPTGLSAMPMRRATGGLEIFRPLLDVHPEAIHDYAAIHDLRWIDDPSNAAERFDRNFVRHSILPRLAERWPAAIEVIARSARLCAATAGAADGVAQASLASMLDGNRLDLDALARLEQPQQSLVMRNALSHLGIPVPSEQQLRLALEGLFASRADAEFQFTWAGGALRRYRGQAWLYDAQDNQLLNAEPDHEFDWQPSRALELGPLAGRLNAVESGPGPGVLAMPGRGWCVRFRHGGERLRVHPEGPERSLKNLLQENDVVPWVRSHIPIICSGRDVVAVGDLWTNADFHAPAGESGIRLDWQPNALISPVSALSRADASGNL